MPNFAQLHKKWPTDRSSDFYVKHPNSFYVAPHTTLHAAIRTAEAYSGQSGIDCAVTDANNKVVYQVTGTE